MEKAPLMMRGEPASKRLAGVPKGDLGSNTVRVGITNEIWPMTLKAKMASSHRSSHTSEDEPDKHRRRMG